MSPKWPEMRKTGVTAVLDYGSKPSPAISSWSQQISSARLKASLSMLVQVAMHIPLIPGVRAKIVLKTKSL